MSRLGGYWPGQPEPTRGRDAHQAEPAAFFKAFENDLENDPYKVMIASDDWTATIAIWSGRMVGPFPGPDGEVLPVDREVLPPRVLHGGSLEGRRDRRGEAPRTDGVPVPAGRVRLEPASITFLAVPDAGNAACN